MKLEMLKRNVDFINNKSKKVCCHCGRDGNLFVDCNFSFKIGEGYERYYHKECERESILVKE